MAFAGFETLTADYKQVDLISTFWNNLINYTCNCNFFKWCSFPYWIVDIFDGILLCFSCLLKHTP